MHLLVSPEARLEYDAWVRYYEQQLAGLGLRLRDEVRAALRRVLDWPLAFPIEHGGIRRALLGRFPYKLYSVATDHVYLIAMAHQHRKPDYWIRRLERSGRSTG